MKLIFPKNDSFYVSATQKTNKKIENSEKMKHFAKPFQPTVTVVVSP